jgi:UPF0755 protein
LSEPWDPFGSERREEPDTQPEDLVPSRKALREAASRTKTRRKESRQRWVSMTVILALVLVIGGVVAKWGWPKLRDIMSGTPAAEDFPGPGFECSVRVAINAGDSGTAIGNTLTEAGVVASTKLFTQAYSQNSLATTIQPGTYVMCKEMRAAGAVEWLLDPQHRAEIKIQIPEGQRATQVFDAIAKETGASPEEVAAAAKDSAAIGLPEQANGDVEGWLFPATYTFDITATPTEILGAMVAKTKAVLGSLGVPQDRWHDIMVLASIIEKETKRDEDRPKASKVFYNRLAKGMLLQSDATVAYGAGVFDEVWSRTEWLQDDNPYNTYVHAGLPKGPICNPGEAAIGAALNPDPDGNWLYFAVVDLETGETEFSDTPEQHEASVEKLRAWERDHPQ